MDLRERLANEQRHPWELARARFFRARVGEHAALDSASAESFNQAIQAENQWPGLQRYFRKRAEASAD